MGVRAIRVEMAEVVAAVAPALTVYDHIPIDPQGPYAFVGWPSIDYDTGTADGAVWLDFRITFGAGLGDVYAAQVAMDDLMSDAIPAALRAHDATSWRALKTSTFDGVDAGPEALTADLYLRVLASLAAD